MKQKVTFNCTLLLLGSLFVHARSLLYHIAPNKSSCVSESNCIDFEMFLQNSSSYITSNTVLRFFPAVYSLETTKFDLKPYEVVINGLTNVTIDSATRGVKIKRAKIACTDDFKVVWIILYCSNIKFRDIEMAECSSEVNTWRSPFEAYTYFTMFTLDTSNFWLENFHLSSERGDRVLISVNTTDNLSILHSKIKGAVRVKYTEDFLSPKSTSLHIESSYFEAGLSRMSKSLQAGLTIISKYSNTSTVVSLIVRNTTFQGLEQKCGFAIGIYSLTLKITLLDLHITHGGLLLKRSGYSNQKLNTANMVNVYITKTKRQCSFRCGLTVIRHTFTIINSTILNSLGGLQLEDSIGVATSSTFENNSNALYCSNSSITLIDAYFARNEKGTTGAIRMKNSFAFFEGETVIENNNGGRYGAIVAHNSTMYIRGSIVFSGNQGFYGGAMSLYSHSILNIKSTTMLVFNNNRAWKNGGAIYCNKDTYTYFGSNSITNYQCIFNHLPSDPKLSFCNNTAVEGGDAIFCEAIYQCVIKESTADPNPITPITVFKSYVIDQSRFCNSTRSSSLVSSDPTYICYCNSTNIDCKNVERYITIVPGQTIQLSLVAVGLLESPVVATAEARLLLPYDYSLQTVYPHIPQQQTRQLLLTTCTQVLYTIHAPEGNQTLIIAFRDTFNDDILSSLYNYRYDSDYKRYTANGQHETPLFIHFTIQPCSTGYILNQKSLSCECHPYLTQAGIRCLLSNQTVIRSGTVWTNATNDTVIIHRYCPLGYCKTRQTELSLTDPSTQCSFQRSGTLCGQCRGNLSQMLGSSDCQECSNLWLLLVIPMTIVSGIVLVIFLMSFNLTVATGTINGLIFYANIIRANNAIYFSTQRYISTRICNVFIAWVNLDVGITMCFYNGLTAYVKTVFQLAFPLYIFTLIAIIIISSHYSTRAARLSGTNAVQVLATLFLLTYSKSIRFVITALQPSTLTIQHYPNNTNTTNLVWLYDGNVDYLQGKHIFLFLLGLLILVLVSFPYTTVLILIQCLQRRSHHKCLSWVWKMSPLFDAYTGPYKTKHRYWTGLLLLLRVALFAVFSLNISGDPSINLLATLIVMLLTLGYIAMVGPVYKSKALSVLECVFLLNLTILSASSLFALQTNRDQEVITNISVILSMVLFCGILMLHAYKRIVSLKVTKRWIKKIQKQESEEERQENDNGQIEKSSCD